MIVFPSCSPGAGLAPVASGDLAGGAIENFGRFNWAPAFAGEAAIGSGGAHG